MLTSSLGMPVDTAAHAYLTSVENTAPGQIIDPRKLAKALRVTVCELLGEQPKKGGR